METVTVRSSSREEECRRLKAELQFLRRKGALRADWEPGAQTGASPGVGGGIVGGIVVGSGGGGVGIGIGGNGGGRACARCRAELGRIINRGAFCRACRLRVCKACREYNVRATDWVCSVCHKHMEIQVATGEWMNEFVRRPSRRRDNRVYVPAADIVKRSIRRSWTISTSHRRSFGGPHGSPELRAYSSLPRGSSYLPAASAAAEAAADAADAADARRTSSDNRDSSTPTHRRLPAHPLLSLLRRGSSSGADDIVPTRRSSSLDEEATAAPLARDDSVFVEKLSDASSTSPGKKAIGRKGVSLRRQQAVWAGSTGSTGAESSGGESPGVVPKSPKNKEPGKVGKLKEKPKETEDGLINKSGGVGEKGGGGKEEEEEEEPVEDFDVEPISGAIFRKVTIRKKKKKKSSGAEEEIDGECDDAGQVGDAPATPSPSPSPTVAPSPSLGRSEKQLQQPAESSRRLGAQDSIDGGVGGGGSSSPAAAALLLDYVLDENKIQPDGEDYKLVFISSDSSSKASTTNSDEEAPAEEDCDWDYFEPARAVVVKEIGADGEEGVVGITPPPSISPAATPVLPAAQLRPTPTPSPPPPPPASRLPEVSKLLPATQSGAGEPCAAGELLPRRIEGEEAGPLEAGCGVVALGDHIFFVEPMPASEGASEGQAGIDGGSAASRRARRRRSRRVGRSRSETDLARLHLRLAPAPDDARAPGERSGSGGFVIDEVPTIVAAGEFGAVEGMRMWTVERDSEEDDGDPEGRKRRTIIPVPVPVPVPSWPERFQREKRDESGAHAIPRGSLGDAVSVADIVYLGPAGSNAVRIRIRSFQRCTSASQEGGGSSRPSVTHVSLVGSASPSPASSWYAWHGVLDANAPSPSSAAPSPPGFTSSVALSASLQDCYSGDGGGGGVGAVLDQIGCGELKEIVEINPSERLSAEIIEEEKLSDTGEKQQLAGEGADAAVNDGGLATAVGSTRPPEAVHEADTESGAAVEADDRRGEGEEKEAEEEGGGGKRMEEAVSTATESIYCEGNAEKTFRNEANFLDMEDTRVNGDVPSLDAIKDVSAEPLECESVTEEAVIMTVGEGERSATVGKEEKGEGEGGEGEERGGEERTISLALTIEVDEDEERRRDDGERRNGLTLDKEGFPRDNESGMEETRAAVSSSSRTERNREERGIIREGVEGGPSVEAKEETSEARESGVDKGIRSDCDKEMESDKEGDEKVTDEMSSAGEESPIPAGRGVEGERIEKEGEENNDDLAGEVLEREECDRIECVVEVLSSAADSEESGGNVIKEERSGTSEAEITASRGENYYYKRSETLENRAESVLIEEEVDGDVGKNKLPLGDKTVEEMGAIPREEEEETGGRDKDALTAEVGIIELAVDAGDGNVAVLEGCPSEGNETKSEDAAPKEESSVAKEEDTEEDEFNEVNREEEMSGDEKSAEESVVLLSHKPLESCEDEVKPPSDGAREKASVATPPSHTLGAREVSQLLEEGEKVGVLSSVGGVVEEWEGKEVGLPRPFSATSTRPTAAERGEEDRTEGEATESSGTPRSVVREIPRGVDESSSERELAARAGETEGAPSPARDESNSNNQTGGGRKRGKRKRNRKRKRRRGKVNKATEEEGEIIPIEPSECCPLPAKMEGEGSDEEESVAAPDSDEYETSSGEFDLATGPRWASIMTPPSVSSNSDAAGNSEESDSDDENFSRVFVVNPADDEEDEGVGRERAEEDEEEEEEDDDVEGRGGVEVIADDGMVKVVRLEGAVLPYGGAGVRLMHIRALTDDDHVATPRSKDVAAVVGDVVIEGQDGLRASGDLPPFKEMADGGVGGSVREVSDSSSEKPLYPESSKEIGIDKCEIEREDFRANGSRTESGCSLIPSCGRDDSHIIDKTDGREFIIKDSSATALDKEEGKAGVDGQVEAEEGVREGGGEREGVDKQNDTGDQSELNEGDAKCLEVVGAEEGEEAMEGMESDAVAMTTESDASPLAVGGVGEVESRESGSGESELQRGGGVEGEGEEEGGLEDPPADGADSEDRAPRNKCIGGADTYVSGGDGVFIADCSVDSVNGGFASEDLKEEEEKFVNAKEDVTNGIKSDDKESAKDEGEIGDIASSDSLCSEVKHSGGVVVAADVCDDVSGEVGGGEEEAVLGEGVAGGASVGNMLHDPPPLSVESSCGAGDGEEVKPPRAGGESVVVVSFSGAAAEGERIHIAASETREEGCEEGVARKDQISSQFHAKATAEQVSLSLSCEGGKGEEWGVGELETGGIRPPSEEKEEDSTTPALKNESGAPREEVGVTSTDGSEMAPPPVGERTSEADRREGGEAPEVTVGEETDPVPAGEPADPTATPASSLLPPLSPTPPPSPTLFPHRRLSLPADPSPPGENGQEEGRTSVDAWKAPREEDKVEALGCHAFGSGSLRWRSVGGGRDGESGRCVSLEDILNPEANARPFSGSGEAAVTTGGGGGVYTSYVMITQDGGVAREGLRRECGASDRQKEEEEEETVGGEEEGVAGERSSVEDVTSGRHQRVNVSVVEVSVVTSETTTLVSEEEDEEEEEMEEEEEGEVSSDEGGVVLKHVNWEEEEGKGNIGLAGYFTLTLETGTASPTPPRRPEIKSRKTIQLKDPSVPGDGVVDIPLCGGELSGGEMSAESDEGRNGGEDAVKVVTGGDTLSAVVCLEEGLADDDSWVEEVDASVDDIREEDDDELGSESASSGDEAYFDREEELRGYNRAIDFTLHTILEESGEESEAESHQKASQGVMGHHTSGSKHRSSVQNSEADASELEKYYFFGLGGIGGNHQDENNDDQKYINEESEISDTVSETSCSSIYSEGLESLGVAGAPGHDGISETADGIMGMDPADLASSRLEKYFLTGFLGLEPPRGLRAPLGDEDGFSENTDESGSVGSDSEGRPSPEQRRKRLVRARGAGRQHHNSGGSGGGAASDAEAATGSPSGGDLSNFSPQVTHTHSQVHHQQQQKLMGQQQQQQALQSQTSGQELGEGGDSSSGSDSFDETAFDKNDGQFDTVKRKKKKRKENRHQEGEAKEEGVAISGDDLDGSKTPQPDLETVAEEEEETGENEGGERMERADEVAAALEAENGMGMGPGGQGNRKQASRDSGFIGSCDDLLKDQQQQRISDGEQRSSGSDRDSKKSTQNDNKVEESVKEGALKKSEETQVPHEGDSKPALDVIGETEVAPLPAIRPVPSGSPASISRTSLSRKDSFNNWSSDEETNLMMSKMRAFFKTMVAGKMASAHCSGLRRSNSGKQSNGSEAHSASSSTNGDVPESAEKVKPPQLVYFENELTRLMKTVPGIRDEQVREIVEYLSSEDTWSDSYDSSDYTSSDLEGAGMGYHGRGPSGPLRTELQQQISASCQQIINNFDTCTDEMEEEDNFVRPKSATTPASDAMNRETAFVYQRLVASFGKVAGGVGEPSSSDASSTPHSSPPLIAKVMHHIGGRLVALMHEVSAAGSGEGGPLASSTSPNGTPFNRNNSAAGSPKTGNNQVAAAMAARYRRLLRREAAAAAKDDKGSVTSTSVESECPSTDTEERSVDSDADSSSSSPPPMSRLPSLPRSKSHDLGQWQRLLLTGEENRRVSAAHSYYYGVSGVGTSAVGGGVGVTGGMMSSSGVHSGGVGGRDNKESLRSSSSGVSDLAEEREEYERLSWKGSFESALAADSRTKLSLEAKRRSAGSGSGSASDLCSSNDQLDHRGRVRSCGSITSAGSRGSLLQQQQLGARARLSASGGDLLAYRSSASRGTVAEEHEGEGDDEGDGDVVGSSGALSRRRRSVPDARGPPGERSTTLPRSNTAVSASTNSLPRLPTVSAPPHGTAAAAIHKSQSLMGHHLQQAHQQQQQQQPHHHHHHLFLQNVKSARYRPPGFRPPPVPPVPPKRAVSVPGLNHQNRGRGERRRQSSGDDTISISENMGKGSSHAAGSTTPTVGSAPPTPGGGKKVSTGSSIGSWTNSPPNSPASTAGVHNATEDDPTNDRVPSVNPPNSSLGIRSDSMASVYSGAGEGRYGTVAVRGEVEFSLQYNYKQGALEISVKQCRDLAPVDTKRNRSDPYVKVYLLPDKSKSGKRKTKVKKHTLNPVFDETLKFHITLNGLETRTLWLTVWHSDMFGRNDFLGEVMMSLEKKVFDDPTPKWYPLQERTEPFDDLLCYKGEMIVGLKFVPPDVTNLHKKGRMSRGSLHVLVKDAKNLTAVKTNGTSDPFCKSYLLPDKGRSSKQKTAVCRRTINPVWNHTFVYEDVSLQELSERSLELTVWDHDRLASNEFLGGLRFNLGTGKHYGKNVDWMDATGREMTLWQSMLGRANFWVEGCLTLRPTLDHRSSPPSTLAS